jgi:triphosphoribosyl-dephospho-CoA synthase
MSLRDTIALHVQFACIWEATARKPGNIHRYRDFDDTTYIDYLQSAAAIAPLLSADPERPVGATVLEAVRTSRQVAAGNTNLGIILLLAPLVKAAARGSVRDTLPAVLDELDVADADAVYAAIRLANPGGLGRVADQNVALPPTRNLREVMTLAADRDLIARQYADGFREVFDDGAPAIRQGLQRWDSLEVAIIGAQLDLMAKYGDTLIRRKRGEAEAAESSAKARHILAAKWPDTADGWTLFLDFDAWLRAVGHARNPGTTADLLAASLFVLLEESHLHLPVRFTWPEGFEQR